MAIRRYKDGKLLKPTEKLKAEKKSPRGGFTAGKYKTAAERRVARKNIEKVTAKETKLTKKIKEKQGLSWANGTCSGASFSACFKSAREKKKSTFTWNGKSYAVALKEKK